MVERTIQAIDGTTLHTRVWSASAPRARVVIVHGFGEHAGRYADIATFLADSGVSVIAYDQRGHGRSGGRRGHIRRWTEYRADLRSVLEVATDGEPIPLFLYGHSLGGTVVLEYTAAGLDAPRGDFAFPRGDFAFPRAVIASAPALGTPGISPLLLTISRALSAVWPGLSLDTKLDATAISRDRAIIDGYRADPLVHSIGSTRLGTELSAAQNAVFAAAPVFPVPLLLTYGSADRLAPREPIERLARAAGCQDKNLRVFDGAYHELHNDIIRDEVYALYRDWILDRV